MSADASIAVAALNQRYLLDYPHEAARQLEAMPAQDVAELLAAPAPHAAARAWQALAPDVAAAVLELVPESLARVMLGEAEPTMAVAVLAQLEPKTRAHMLKLLDAQVARELRALLKYPEDSAGRIMDPQVSPVREDHTVGEALARLRALKRRGLREMFVVNADGVLIGRVEIQDLAVSDDGQKVRELVRGLGATVRELDPREEVVAAMQRSPTSSLAVVNHAGRPVGVIRQAALVSAIEEEASADLLTMVGASRDERALSGPMTGVRKRLAWLQINLLTAFLAASVVGMFEGLIAKFTALAVLLPVVAGQSGNAGAQALAVTMRGLFMREITLRHLPRVLAKEAAHRPDERLRGGRDHRARGLRLEPLARPGADPRHRDGDLDDHRRHRRRAGADAARALRPGPGDRLVDHPHHRDRLHRVLFLPRHRDAALGAADLSLST